MIRHSVPLLAAAFLAAPAAAAEVQIQAHGPVVELTVSEVVHSRPDVAQIGAGVQTRAQTAQEAVRQNAAAMERLIARLRDLGIERRDIQTSNFSLNVQYDYNREGGPPSFVGYDVTNQVSVRLRDTDRIGPVLDALVAAGANNIFGPNFLLEDDAAAKEQARALAFERGREMARRYAAMAGYSDVRLLEISESFQSYGPPVPMAALRQEAADASTPIEPGEVGTVMRKLFIPIATCALLAAGFAAPPAMAQGRGDQESARKEMRAGNVMTLREIERIVVPQIERRGANLKYLTPEFDEVARAYRLKFIDNDRGQMVWVDVDARNGRILRISR